MITIVTALFDGRNFGIPHSTEIYDASWADKLYRGIKRNTNIQFRMVCLVDKDYQFEEDIHPIKFYSKNNTFFFKKMKKCCVISVAYFHYSIHRK